MKSNSFRAAYFLTALASMASLSAYNYEIKTLNRGESTAEPANLKLPAGFNATIVADDFGAVRHLAVTKKGGIYFKLAKLKDGKGLYHLRDTDNDGFLDQQTGIGNYPGTGIAIKNNYLYSASNTGVFRYKLNEKDEVIRPEQPETIVQGLVAKTRDVSKSITLDNNTNIN